MIKPVVRTVASFTSASSARYGMSLLAASCSHLTSRHLSQYWEESFGTTPQAAGKVERPTTGVWNTITVGGKTMQEAVSEFWNEPVEREGGSGTTRLVAPAKLYQDPPWDPNGKPPSGSGGTPELAAQMHGGAPVVPWYTAKWMSNPTCRGYPWY